LTELLHDLIFQSARRAPDAPALCHGKLALNYDELAGATGNFAQALVALGLGVGERVAVYLEKRVETVVATFGAAAAGGVFVPVNPVLRPHQVAHILADCSVRVLVTSSARLATLTGALAQCHDLNTIILVDDGAAAPPAHVEIRSWSELLDAGAFAADTHGAIDTDVAAILYTSGSTGLPKGVVLSHRNMVAGARSVSQYLGNRADDRILCVLPFSFDAGFSQMTTAFNVGACAILQDYLLPRDVVRLAARERITGIGGVPPLWNQLAELDWPEDAVQSIRYFTNTGGHMPRVTLDKLRAALPNAEPFLMYGLTEAFRSTYLPPGEIDRRPDSIGKAIPNAEILVVRENGELCAPGEPGELVHRGPLVALGYWNDPERTAERFKPAPKGARSDGVCLTEIAVWSGDTVHMDDDGFLYFVGRRDEMIKSSGYRISPTELEEVVYGSGLVGEAVALGVPHPTLGQGIVIAATAKDGGAVDCDGVIAACRETLPAYMVPHAVVARDSLARNPNGKIDRKSLARELSDIFEAETP
jgi:acyl-CoA ligase (AMP-forming) (exosortase A-associated)